MLCHVGADHDYAPRLVLRLRGAGLPVWWLGSLEPGGLQFWAIRRRLRHAVGVIVLMSPPSQDSDDITRMIIEGELHARPFIPILLHGRRTYHLAHTWYVDARDGGPLRADEPAILRRIHRAHAADRLEEGRPAEVGRGLDAEFMRPLPAPHDRCSGRQSHTMRITKIVSGSRSRSHAVLRIVGVPQLLRHPEAGWVWAPIVRSREKIPPVR
ncbi:toll/interleukin-1 receptor domain-containing protein [Nonomuraea sp. NPDC003201]